LSELPTDESRTVALLLLWEMVAPDGVLIIVENGNFRGMDIVQKARKDILSGRSCREFYDDIYDEHGEKVEGDDCNVKYMPDILAPCTHNKSCPLNDGRFPEGRYRTGCHFMQVTDRYVTVASKTGQGKGKKYRKSNFSYIAFRKNIGDGEGADMEKPSSLGRLIRKPILGGEHVTLDLCQANGSLGRVIITKQKNRKPNTKRMKYRAARKSTWGGLWPNEEIE